MHHLALSALVDVLRATVDTPVQVDSCPKLSADSIMDAQDVHVLALLSQMLGCLLTHVRLVVDLALGLCLWLVVVLLVLGLDLVWVFCAPARLAQAARNALVLLGLRRLKDTLLACNVDAIFGLEGDQVRAEVANQVKEDVLLEQVGE